MTISEYMNNLALESMAVANEMACDAMLCDLYAANYDEDTSAAYESIDLAFDDDDDGYYAEPATEAGFFKSLGNKFKSVLETIKGWFEKMASTIRGWITKFTEHIKSKIENAKKKNQAKKIVRINADFDASKEAIDKRRKEINEKIAKLKEQYSTEKNSSKSQQINNEIAKLESQLESLKVKAQTVIDNKAISLGKVYAQNISNGLKQAETAFTVACKDQATIEKMFRTIINTKLSSKNKNSALVGDKISFDENGAFNGDASAATNALNTDGMLKDLEKMQDDLIEVAHNVSEGASAATKAYGEFNDACGGSEDTKCMVISKVNCKLPSRQLTVKAESMAKECGVLKDKTESLAKLFGDAPAEGSTEKDKRPEIAKVLSVYSKVASQLISIAQSYLAISTKGEILAVVADAPDDFWGF